MTLQEIRSELIAKIDALPVKSSYKWEDCRRSQKKERFALCRALRAIDAYYRHTQETVQLYCKHL
jgi:hypothetical protein